MLDPNQSREPEPTPRRRTPLWMRLLLGVSLGVNVLVIGVIVGLSFFVAGDGDRRPPMRASGLTPFVGAFPPNVRPDVVAALRSEGVRVRSGDRNKGGNDRGGHRPKRLSYDLTASVQVLRQDPFDPTALLAQLEIDHQRVSGFIEASHSVLVEQIATLSPEERQAYADRLERFGKFRHDGGHRSFGDRKD